MVARKDAGLSRMEDLNGRRVAAVVGTSTFFDVRALTLEGYGFDIQKDTQIVTATAPADMATLLAKKEVDASPSAAARRSRPHRRGGGASAQDRRAVRRGRGRAAGTGPGPSLPPAPDPQLILGGNYD